MLSNIFRGYLLRWYQPFKAFISLISFAEDMARIERKPGIRFSERMHGKVTMTRDGDLSNCEFVVTVESQDVENMLTDSNHAGTVAGTVTCPGLSTEPLTISSG